MGESRTPPDDDAPPASAHSVIRRGHALWLAQRPGPGLLPGRQHIRPADMPALLPHVWLLDVAGSGRPGDPPALRIRLAGSHVGGMPALSRSGRWLDEAGQDFPWQPAAQAPFLAAIAGRRAQYYRGPPELPGCQAATAMEMLLLPLAGDGHAVDMLLGFIVFYISDGRVMPTAW